MEQDLTQEQKNWAVGAHLGPLVVALIGLGVVNWAVPLYIYLARRDQGEFVGDHARESLNFRITLAVAYAICSALVLIGIGIPLMVLVWLGDLVFTIMASLRANDGARYRYPFVLRLIS